MKIISPLYRLRAFVIASQGRPSDAAFEVLKFTYRVGNIFGINLLPVGDEFDEAVRVVNWQECDLKYDRA